MNSAMATARYHLVRSRDIPSLPLNSVTLVASTGIERTSYFLVTPNDSSGGISQ